MDGVTGPCTDAPQPHSSPVATTSCVPSDDFQQKASTVTRSSSSLFVKPKPNKVGCQDQVKSRMLEMAEKEHEQKMKNLKLKHDVLSLQYELLKKQVNASGNDAPQRPVWQPFA